MIKKLLKFLIPLKIRIVISRIIFRTKNYFLFIYTKMFGDKQFTFNGNEYNYFRAFYNTTFLNERTVEIPIILDYITKFQGKRILEIGNVISHYFDFKYDILDKYEKQEGVINLDIIDFVPEHKYDLIISISTFEHIGFDENIRYGKTEGNTIKATAVLKAIEVTKELLNKNGIFIFTIPLGFNHFLDSKLENNSLKLTNLYYVKRMTSGNVWKQVVYDEVKNIRYGHPYICANGILVGVFKND